MAAKHLPSRGVDHQSLTLCQPEFLKTGADLDDQFLIFIKGQVGVAGQLVVRPLLLDLLLDTIDHLLDLLVLNMGLDQTARADALGVAKELRATPDNVEGRRGVFIRAFHELVLGGDNTTGDGLAFDGFISWGLHGERPLLDHARLDVEEVT